MSARWKGWATAWWARRLRACADGSQTSLRRKGCSGATRLTLAGQAPRPTVGEVQATTVLRCSEPDGLAAGRRRTDSPSCLERTMNGVTSALNLLRATPMQRENGAFTVLGAKVTVSGPPADGQPGCERLETRPVVRAAQTRTYERTSNARLPASITAQRVQPASPTGAQRST